MYREKKRNLLQRTARACADGEGEKNTDTGRAARAALCCCMRSPACGCAACQIYAALGAWGGFCVRCQLCCVVVLSPFFLFLLFVVVLGKKGMCLCFGTMCQCMWRKYAERAGPTPGFFGQESRMRVMSSRHAGPTGCQFKTGAESINLDKGNARPGMEKQIHLEWQ